MQTCSLRWKPEPSVIAIALRRLRTRWRRRQHVVFPGRHAAAQYTLNAACGHFQSSTSVIPPFSAVARSGAKRPSPTSWQA
ncbi:hypothetical protein TP49_01375 [Xanthomonas citri pv. aurantifolii]|nr:hypothetical protein TP50_08225 [Xanthomonas citri pv. aurantifolii]TBX00497.1 hypothetical protein TP49_01375 [Xanthomonas citri pv. aurantifolii]